MRIIKLESLNLTLQLMGSEDLRNGVPIYFGGEILGDIAELDSEGKSFQMSHETIKNVLDRFSAWSFQDEFKARLHQNCTFTMIDGVKRSYPQLVVIEDVVDNVLELPAG